MNCTRVDHIGIAVKDLAASVKWYEETLGLQSKGTEVVEEQKVTVAFLPCGDSELELLESTNDIDAALAELKEKGVRLIDQTPRYGAGGARIAFLHPKATHGVLLELCERK